MKILMLGWEFPPLFAGGVGIVCYELTKTLSMIADDLDLTYIMPFGPENFEGCDKTSHLKLIITDNFGKEKEVSIKINIRPVKSLFNCYITEEEYEKEYKRLLKDKKFCSKKNIYGKNLYEEVQKFAIRTLMVVKSLGENFDLIHAHDWMVYPAAILLKEYLNVPFIAHIHNTVYDRYLNENSYEKSIEKKGFDCSDLIIAVSNYVKNHLIEKYGVPEAKIRVVHNGGITDLKREFYDYDVTSKNEKIVLYAGRVVLQKGPEYFIRAAKRVLEYEPNARFIFAGTGHMLNEVKDLAEKLGIKDKIYFHGFYTRDDAELFYSIADVFIMPSISEPFGIVPLEAISKSTPVVISKQSGISEVLNHCFKVDFWDVDEMADKIVSLLKYEPLHNEMRRSAFNELNKFDWIRPSKEILQIYRECIYNYRNNHSYY